MLDWLASSGLSFSFKAIWEREVQLSSLKWSLGEDYQDELAHGV